MNGAPWIFEELPLTSTTTMHGVFKHVDSFKITRCPTTQLISNQHSSNCVYIYIYCCHLASLGQYPPAICMFHRVSLSAFFFIQGALTCLRAGTDLLRRNSWLASAGPTIHLKQSTRSPKTSNHM